MSILIIRHGETAWNASRKVQFPCTPLSERGKAQALRLGRHLASRPIRLILCSDYARARMTAEPLRHNTGAPLRYTPLLRERNFGIHRGTFFEEHETNIFADDYHPPGGESVTELHARVATAWEEVVQSASGVEGDVAVVSHALVCRSMLQEVLGLVAGGEQGPVRWPNTGYTVLDGPPWSLEILAGADHLEDSGVADANHPAGI
ncbi:MAG: histidine phosphatase family protein [Gammaproteobacteria bacterium]